MQTIQIQGFNNISDQNIYLENIEYLKQHLNEILEISEQTLAENLIKETEILLKQTQDTSKTYRAKEEIFRKLTRVWREHWDHYGDRPEAIDLIKSIKNLRKYFGVYYHIFRGLSLINEKRTGNKQEDRNRMGSGLLIILNTLDHFIEYFSITQLKQIYLQAKNILFSINRDIDEYLEEKGEGFTHHEFGLPTYCNSIILKIERSVNKFYLIEKSQSQISNFSENINWDLLVNNHQGKLILGVEVKSKINTSSPMRVKFRHNLLTDSYVQKIPFFLMVFSDRFYLCTNPEIYSSQSEQIYGTDTLSVLKPYFERAKIRPGKIREDSFKLLVVSWLCDIINSEKLPEEFDESQRWLIDSGLYVAISGGDLKYGASK
jgi:hypothetical protein